MTPIRRTFDPIATSAHGARCLVEGALGPRSDIDVDVVVLLVSELATNAIVHSRTSFDIEVLDLDRGVRVSVEDRSSDGLPTPRSAGDGDTGGRGIAIVASVADAWGSERTGTGKRVWFEIHGRRDGRPPTS